jgi:hypothetical protein
MFVCFILLSGGYVTLDFYLASPSEPLESLVVDVSINLVGHSLAFNGRGLTLRPPEVHALVNDVYEAGSGKTE